MYSQNEDWKEYIENRIFRQTNRGRKELISLPKNFLKYDICLKYIIYSNEELFKCYICKCLFHKLCYDQYIVVSSDNGNLKYRCVRCEQALKNNKKLKIFIVLFVVMQIKLLIVIDLIIFFIIKLVYFFKMR